MSAAQVPRNFKLLAELEKGRKAWAQGKPDALSVHQAAAASMEAMQRDRPLRFPSQRSQADWPGF